MSAIWIAADGTYGSGQIASIDTTEWTESDFDELADAPDCTRLELAFAIAASHIAGRLR